MTPVARETSTTASTATQKARRPEPGPTLGRPVDTPAAAQARQPDSVTVAMRPRAVPGGRPRANPRTARPAPRVRKAVMGAPQGLRRVSRGTLAGGRPARWQWAAQRGAAEIGPANGGMRAGPTVGANEHGHPKSSSAPTSADPAPRVAGRADERRRRARRGVARASRRPPRGPAARRPPSVPRGTAREGPESTHREAAPSRRAGRATGARPVP